MYHHRARVIARPTIGQVVSSTINTFLVVLVVAARMRIVAAGHIRPRTSWCHQVIKRTPIAYFTRAVINY